MTSNNKDYKMRRRTADRLLENMMTKVREYNANPDNPYMFKDIVIFGSYVNEPETVMISDLDVGFDLKKRYHGKDFKICENLAQEWCADEMPSLRRDVPVIRRTDEYALRFIKDGSAYISLHRIGLDDDAIFSKRIMRMSVGDVNTYASGEFEEMMREIEEMMI